MQKIKIKNFFKNKSLAGFSLAVVVCALAGFGIVMIYSASSYSAAIQHGDAFFFVKKQAVGFVLGVICLVLFSFVDYHIFGKFSLIFMIIGLVLLGVVLIPGIGRASFGARRWVSLGPLSFQASEVAKFCFVFFSAAVLSKQPDMHQKFSGVLKVLAVGGAYCVLIMLEPNMSVTMLLAFVMILMLFVGGLKLSRFFAMALPASAGVVGLILVEPYRLKRLMAFINPWESPLGEGYQLIQSLYSFGNGGLFGVGLFQSRQKFLFLPFSESDFIFSIIGEELGLVGAIFVLLVFAFVIFMCYKAAFTARDRFGCYLAFGIASLLAVQTLLNVAVVTGSIPPTGLPLPFISAGSTSLVVFMSAIGVVLNINKQSKSRV